MTNFNGISRRHLLQGAAATSASGLIVAGGSSIALGSSISRQKTPGVYIVEKDAVATPIVPVSTGIAAFIGYTQKAVNGATNVSNRPTMVSSWNEFVAIFGGPPAIQFQIAQNGGTYPIADSRFLLYYSVAMFFNNGGGIAYIVSIGNYGSPGNRPVKSAAAFTAALTALETEREPAIILAPDAVTLPYNDWKTVTNALLDHCGKTKSRFAILDVYNGYAALTNSTGDVISGTHGFRNSINSPHLGYGAAYYPWLNTNLVAANQLSFAYLNPTGKQELSNRILAEQRALNGGSNPPQAMMDLIGNLTKSLTAQQIQNTHANLWSQSTFYKNTVTWMGWWYNLQPPSGAMAGLYAQIDANMGTHRSPANVALKSVASPTVAVPQGELPNLNTPTDGKAVNPIKTFPQKGTLPWGARTLDGNSHDFRYIAIRRTLIFIEQSIKYALKPHVFSPNSSSTWSTVNAQISNFLKGLWKSGALQGNSAAESFSVHIGLGSSMTPQDVLDGYLIVTVRVALARPAEFLVFTVRQKMQ